MACWENKIDEAINLYNLYLETYDNKDIIALLNLADLYIQKNNIIGAENIYKRLIEIDNNIFFLNSLLKIYYFNYHNYTKAIEICDEMLKINPNLLNIYFNKAYLLLKIGKKQEAYNTIYDAKDVNEMLDTEIDKYLSEHDVSDIKEFVDINY